MSIPAALKYWDERDNHQRERDKRKENMRSEDWEINRRKPAGVTRRFLAGVNVINNVSDEKQG